MHDYRTASKYYKDAEKQYDIMQPNMKIYFLNNYGNFYYYQHDYPNALKMFLRMRDEIVTQQGAEGNDASDINLCRINLADVYLNLGNADSAQVLVEKCDSVDVGEIGIFVVNGDVFIKERGNGCLISHNEKYKPIRISEHDSVFCCGRVVGRV